MELIRTCDVEPLWGSDSRLVYTQGAPKTATLGFGLERLRRSQKDLRLFQMNLGIPDIFSQPLSTEYVLSTEQSTEYWTRVLNTEY
jgi:hypothetical protein